MNHNNMQHDLEFVLKYSDEITNHLLHKHDNSNELLAELFSIMQRMEEGNPVKGRELIQKIASETRSP